MFSLHIGTFDNLILAIAEVALVYAILNGIERKNTYYYPPQPKKRKDFSKSTKEGTKLRQGFVCNSCKKPPEFWEFHHIDDKSNNSPSNCEGLCPNCHRKRHSEKG